MGKFVSLVGFKTLLEETLQLKDNILPVSKEDMAYLHSQLGEDNYTYLVVRGVSAQEIIKVTGVKDCAVMIERAQEGTNAIVAKYDSCVLFEWTDRALADFIQQGMGGITPAVISVKSGNGCLSVETVDGEVKITQPEQKKVSWRSGNKIYTQNKCGVVTSEDVSLSEHLADGEYQNATLVVKNGEIVAVKSGTNIVYSGGGCCACSGKAEQ